VPAIEHIETVTDLDSLADLIEKIKNEQP